MEIYGQAIVFRNYPGRIWRDALHRIMTSIFYHYLFLENLLIIRKLLIHKYIKTTKTAKGTNWEQKFQKPQNENIGLTNLNVENNSNF